MKKINLHVTKIRNVKTPNKAHLTDSWIDFFIPNDINDLFNAENCIFTPKEVINLDEQKRLKKTYFNLKEWKIIIPSWYWILIPSWIKISITDKETNNWVWLIDENYTYDLVFHNKSWVATKKNLIVWASVVDEPYRWEIHFHLINASKFNIEISTWEKIIQWIIRPVMNSNILK